MEAITRDRPAFANVQVKLDSGESIIAEADAMSSMSTGLTVQTKWNGGFLSAILRRLFGGESLFVNEFQANESSELVFTQAYPGDIECLDLNGTSLFLQPGAFIACEHQLK